MVKKRKPKHWNNNDDSDESSSFTQDSHQISSFIKAQKKTISQLSVKDSVDNATTYQPSFNEGGGQQNGLKSLNNNSAFNLSKIRNDASNMTIQTENNISVINIDDMVGSIPDKHINHLNISDVNLNQW